MEGKVSCMFHGFHFLLFEHQVWGIGLGFVRSVRPRRKASKKAGMLFQRTPLRPKPQKEGAAAHGAVEETSKCSRLYKLVCFPTLRSGQRRSWLDHVGLFFLDGRYFLQLSFSDPGVAYSRVLAPSSDALCYW